MRVFVGYKNGTTSFCSRDFSLEPLGLHMTVLQDDHGLLPDALVPYFSTVIKDFRTYSSVIRF
jgi:hypothetical protein